MCKNASNKKLCPYLHPPTPHEYVGICLIQKVHSLKPAQEIMLVHSFYTNFQGHLTVALE